MSVDRSLVPTGGDSSFAAGARFLTVLDDLRNDHHAGVAVLVTHGRVTTDALRTLLGDDVLNRCAPGIIQDGIAGCAITTLRADPGGWAVERIADASHLSPP